jgi:hypothetical protein
MNIEGRELQIGKAGEYLVCADLILNGFVSFLSEQGLPYDLLLDNGNKLLKVQVKTTIKPRFVQQRANETRAYIFDTRRHGKGTKGEYQSEHLDLFALVCLDTKQIGYIKFEDGKSSLLLRVDELKGTYYDEKGEKDYKLCMKMKELGYAQKQIADVTKLHISQVSRYLQDGYKPFQTETKYFSEIIRDAEWFKNL